MYDLFIFCWIGEAERWRLVLGGWLGW